MNPETLAEYLRGDGFDVWFSGQKVTSRVHGQVRSAEVPDNVTFWARNSSRGVALSILNGQARFSAWDEATLARETGRAVHGYTATVIKKQSARFGLHLRSEHTLENGAIQFTLQR
jgi:hypothetical protein